LLKKEIIARTISIEVGMQNSGLGVVLARENFTSPLVAVPPAISSLFHSLISSLLVFLWKWIDRRIVKK
jgi:BASS family bile acid:Na+ symporter